ncbi:UNVERIFIED_CONTAM: hypothetical protein Slati_3761200 [Sesamum latifolium]|uniref:Uncharacterized protein n=1 Tax=Sesamum latifolium TaxID=2727402 RepID=A0AAW2U357_9LAMI
MNAKIAGRLRALRNAVPRAEAAPAPFGAEGSAAPSSAAPIVVVSADAATPDNRLLEVASGDLSEIGTVAVTDDPGPSDPKKRKRKHKSKGRGSRSTKSTRSSK